MWEHEKFSPRSDCREACLDTVPWMSDGFSKKHNQPGNRAVKATLVIH